jgi:hypothetical protein
MLTATHFFKFRRLPDLIRDLSTLLLFAPYGGSGSALRLECHVRKIEWNFTLGWRRCVPRVTTKSEALNRKLKVRDRGT